MEEIEIFNDPMNKRYRTSERSPITSFHAPDVRITQPKSNRQLARAFSHKAGRFEITVTGIQRPPDARPEGNARSNQRRA
ncbi:hypothetical protein EVAR_24787_1 [Eumeta japonica]|uniref:Uncharacterized protein n=1 Tax=Eumeta variegata TaxID=151549 RepID=A0A4C1W3Y0_EUMVA|nr:hypothetical protein EVAR_24787_1 [Eumeta japonica]